jgi:predicted dehydrogenase
MNETPIRIALAGADSGDLRERFGSPSDAEWVGEGDDPHAVVVGHHPKNAFELIEGSLQSGRSVFCAAPMGFSPRQLQALAELSAVQSRILRFSEPYRYLGGFPLLRRLLGGSEPFWRAFYLRSEWCANGIDDVPLKAMAMQELALYDSVFSGEPRSVSATAFDDHVTSGPCAVTLSVAYEDSPPLQCTVSYVEAVEQHRFVAVLADRMVTLEQRHDAPGLSIVGRDGPAAPPLLKRLDPDVSTDSALSEELRDFVNAVATNNRSFTNAARWLRPSTIWSAARRSIRSGRRVDVLATTPSTTMPPPLIMIEGGGSKRTFGPRPALTLVAG